MPVPASLDIDALKARVDVQLASNAGLLEDYLEAAFQQAQAPPPHGCGRNLEPEPALVGDPPADTEPAVQKTFTVRSRYVLVPDARVIDEVLVDDVAVTDYDTFVRDGHIVRIELARPTWHEHFHEARRKRVVKVTGRFGFVEIPAALREAIYILAGRLFYERDAQYADQVAIAEGTGVQAYYRQLPPRAKLAFATYAVPAGLAGLA